jgi:hypothetical protein
MPSISMSSACAGRSTMLEVSSIQFSAMPTHSTILPSRDMYAKHTAGRLLQTSTAPCKSGNTSSDNSRIAVCKEKACCTARTLPNLNSGCHSDRGTFGSGHLLGSACKNISQLLTALHAYGTRRKKKVWKRKVKNAASGLLASQLHGTPSMI